MNEHPVEFSLRPAADSDREFLFALHCKTMRDVIEATWGWDGSWQRRDFDRRLDEYVASVIEHQGHSVGGLIVESTPDSIHVHELQLLPEFQCQGIGTAVVRHLIKQAALRGATVALSVVPANPRARRLYERLGFEVTGFEAPFFRMRHNAASGDS